MAPTAAATTMRTATSAKLAESTTPAVAITTPGSVSTRYVDRLRDTIRGAETAVGVDKETAVPAVFPFRLATFWLPVLPGGCRSTP